MSLSSEEHVIYSTRLSKKLFVKPLILSVLVLVLDFLSKIIVPQYAHFVFWPLIALAVLLLVPPFTRYFLSHFVLTNQRVLIRHGFFTRTSYEMILEKIESIAVNQSLADRLVWGAGTLVITGTGGTKEEFPNVGRAIAFQEHLNEALHAK